MPEERVITCIVCPRGCEIRVLTEGGEVLSIEGATCSLGEKYAEKEVRNPERVLITVIPCRGGDPPTVSVKTEKPIPLKQIMKAAKELAKVEVRPPIEVGDTIIESLLNLGVRVIATRPCKPTQTQQPKPLH